MQVVMACIMLLIVGYLVVKLLIEWINFEPTAKSLFKIYKREHGNYYIMYKNMFAWRKYVKRDTDEDEFDTIEEAIEIVNKYKGGYDQFKPVKDKVVWTDHDE